MKPAAEGNELHGRPDPYVSTIRDEAQDRGDDGESMIPAEDDVELANATIVVSSAVRTNVASTISPEDRSTVISKNNSTNTTVLSNESNDEDDESTANLSAMDYTYGVLDCIKLVASMALLVFSIAVVTAATISRQTVMTSEKNIHPIFVCFVFWSLTLWLAMMESGQGALVGLQPIDKALYRTSHPRTLRTATLVHEHDNLARFIVGRQFLVVLVVFGLQFLATPSPGVHVLYLNSTLTDLFLNSGIAVLVITITLGQLSTQVNAAATCLLDSSNNHLLYLTTHISLLIEQSGLLHAVYLVQAIFVRIMHTSNHNEATSAPRKTMLQTIWFGARVGLSCLVLIFSLVVTFAALWANKTTSYQGLSAAVSTVLLLVLLTLMGLMEGMQIAIFAVANMPDLSDHLHAYANSQIAFRDQNLESFLIGRQMFVTICIFIIARITTIRVADDDASNIFGVPDGVQWLFHSGLLGAVITTLVGSLAWRIVAFSFPVAFLSNPLIRWMLRICFLLEASGICSSAWVMARFNQQIAKCQPDAVYLRGSAHRKKTWRDRNIDVAVKWARYIYSMVLLLFSVTIVMTAIFMKQTKVAAQAHPWVAFCVLWVLILWLAVMEGGQGCLVGLQPVDKDRYYGTHPVAHMVTTLVHKGDNMDRFIVGRQFLVVLVVFVANMCGSRLPSSTSLLGLPQKVTDIFLGSGVAMSLMTIVLGQLTAQVNAAECMLDFINNNCMLLTSYLALAIEWTGLLHSVYLVQTVVAVVAGKSSTSDQQPRRTRLQSLFFWARVVLSLGVLGLSFTVTLKALFQGKTTMYEGVPKSASVAIFFFLMCFVGLMEGMQIALFSVVNLPREELERSPMAAKTCALTFAGKNLQTFLIGRQICVTLCTFIIARITSLDVQDGSNLLGVSDSIQAFFNTGLLGAVITTIVASLAWRIVASSFPVAFLSNPLVYVILRLCLVIEASGVCAAARFLASIHKWFVGYQVDEVYIGGARENQ